VDRDGPTLEAPADDDVHVWRSVVPPPGRLPPGFLPVLSAGERARVFRYRFERDRRRAAASRAGLRLLLAAYTGREAAAIDLREDALGKPTLEPATGIEFNVSHSHELVVYAVARRRVGIDIEHVRPLQDSFAIARRFFSSDEIAALHQAAAPVRNACFFACWTRKEAYLKAWGKGLSHPLSGFSVSVDPSRAEFRSPNGLEGDRWTLVNLELPAGYIGALAIEAPVRRLVHRDWTPSV
jgi:4'-phosphopantetheinyl transferase